MSKTDLYLQRTLDIARLGGRITEPNPRVGSVIVHQDRIIGEGYHRQHGGPHAEVNAIRSVKETGLLPHSTLYVNLEPCNHFGKTPPCSHLIVEHNIPRVVIGCTDPNPQVAGKGIEYLRSHGVQVEVSGNQAIYRRFNRHFFINQLKKRAYIHLKWAQSKDGFIAAHSPEGIPIRTTISHPASNRIVHRLRSTHHALLIGKNTAQIDNPSLTTRSFFGTSPIPILLDHDNALDKSLKVFSQHEKVIIVNATRTETVGNLHYFKPDGQIKDLKNVCKQLYDTHRIGSILVEGGREVLHAFLDQDLFDEISCIEGTTFLGEGVSAPNLPQGLNLASEKLYGPDTWKSFRKGIEGGSEDTPLP